LGYLPCHWKGHALLAAAISIALGTNLLVPDVIPLTFAFVIWGMVIMAFEVIARRHSRPK